MALLLPCAGCGENRKADEGHALCRSCEGYGPKRPASYTDEDRNRWIQLFNRLDAAVSRHRKKDGAWADDADEALWDAHDKILKAAATRKDSDG